MCVCVCVLPAGCVSAGSAAVSVKYRATIQVLKHIVNMLEADSRGEGWRRRGEEWSSVEVVNKYLLKIYLTAIHLILFLSPRSLSLSIWIMLTFKNLIYSIHWFCFQKLARPRQVSSPCGQQGSRSKAFNLKRFLLHSNQSRQVSCRI